MPRHATVYIHNLNFPRQRQCLSSLNGISSHGARIPNVPQLAISRRFIARGEVKSFMLLFFFYSYPQVSVETLEGSVRSSIVLIRQRYSGKGWGAQ